MLNIFLVILAIIPTTTLGIFLYFLYTKNLLAKSIAQNNGDYVVLLHGLKRTSFSMQKIGKELAKIGYRVINIDYSSKNNTLKNIAEKTLKEELEKNYKDKSKKINFVTHSMGGIIVRYFLINNHLENIGRVVMLAPPNKGSEAADKWSKTKAANYLMGPTLKNLTTHKESLVSTLPLPNYEVGIIAGTFDKKVSIERTKIDNMTDFVITPNGHTRIMKDNMVIAQIIHFLANGKFKK